MAGAAGAVGGAAGTIVEFAGTQNISPNNTGDGGQARLALVTFPGGVASDSAGDVFIAATGENRIRKVDPTGIITNLAGAAAGTAGDVGDGGAATSATLHSPVAVAVAVAVDGTGKVYIADSGNNRVRKVDAGGVISNLAGSPGGTAGNSGDGGPATSATLRNPSAVAVDRAGNVYVADSGNNRVRKIDAAGIITNVAGSPAGRFGNTGDGGAARAATLSSPEGLALDAAGNLLVSDSNDNRVRKIDAAGIITNVAGSSAGTLGNTGDGSAATSATLDFPVGIAVDTVGDVYVADSGNSRIRKVDTAGVIGAFAGSPAGTVGNSGDGGPATSATLGRPFGLATDDAGDVYIADPVNDRVREVLASTVDEPPVVATAVATRFTLGSANSFSVVAFGYPQPTLQETGTLPTGVTFDTATGTLRGTPSPGTGGSYPITFTASNGIGSDARQYFTLTVTALPGYTAVVPVRLCDTRPAGPGVLANQCDVHGHTPLSTGGVLTLAVAGSAGVPADATAVVLHTTATGTSAASYLTVWPTGQARPATVSITWTPGQSVSNLVETGVGTGGQVSVFNHAGGVDVVVDLEGYVRAATGQGLFVSVAPVRVCDTRAGQSSNGCNQTGAGTLGAGRKRVVNVTAGFGVPAGAVAVVLNVTATGTSAASYLDIWPNGATPPPASSLNWSAGQTVSNRVITAIPASGNIDLLNAYGNTDVVMDLGGYFTNRPDTAGAGYVPIAPLRICDTRPVGPGVPATRCNDPTLGLGTFGPGVARSLVTVNAPNITALVFNVTVTDTRAAGFLTVFPDDDATVPLAADVTWAANQTIGNLVVADLGSNATTDFFNGSTGSTDVIVDLVGYYSTTVVAPGAAVSTARFISSATGGRRPAPPAG